MCKTILIIKEGILIEKTHHNQACVTFFFSILSHNMGNHHAENYASIII